MGKRKQLRSRSIEDGNGSRIGNVGDVWLIKYFVVYSILC